jgi:twitching motility protein PilT
LLFRPSGMIIVTGATGSGKTTTLASIVDHLSKTERPRKIVSVEDPIEYEIPHGNGLVVQREVGTDTPSFNEALIDALRQDPNIIVIGELRDSESVLTSLMAAETGHLVFTTLHTPDAPSTISRMISAVPPSQQELARSLLAATLQMVIAQELLPRADKQSLVLAVEVLVVTDVVRRLIRENKPEQIYDIMHTGAGAGMVSKDQSLIILARSGAITREVALPRMRMPQMLAL